MKLISEDSNSSAGGRTRTLIPWSAVLAQSPDNSKTNQQVRGSAAADQQAENQSDRDLAGKIRKSIMDDKNLSTYARNVRIITGDGTATLKGLVGLMTRNRRSNAKSEITVKSKNEN